MNLIRRARLKSEIEKIQRDDTVANFQSAFFRLIDRYSHTGIDPNTYHFVYASETRECPRAIEAVNIV